MAITVAMRTQVSQLYVSLFGRAPDGEGLGFWVAALAGGMTMAQIYCHAQKMRSMCCAERGCWVWPCVPWVAQYWPLALPW